MNFQAVGFCIVLGVVGLGVDYHQQTVKSDLELGELSASAYLGTITGRFAEVQAEKQAKIAEKERKSKVKEGARPYLPEAPEGWSRREWAAGDNSRISQPPREMTDFEKKAVDENPILKGMVVNSEARSEELRNAQSWVYERGDEVVSIRAQFVEMPKGNTITNNAVAMVAGNLEAMSIMTGWGVIQGVAFVSHDSILSKKPKHYRTLNAVVGFGDEIRLSVRSNTDDEAIREILGLIDYDGLNALLPRPLSHVGSGAEDIPLEQQAEYAERMMEIRSDLIQQRTAAASEWLKAASNPEDAMTLALRQTGLDVEGSMGAEDAALAETMQELEDEALKPVAAPGAEKKADAGKAFDKLKAFLGFSAPTEHADAGPQQEVVPQNAPKTGVKRLGAGSSFASCNSEGAFKSCKLGE